MLDRNSDHLAFGARRVRQRTEHIENRSYSQFAADWPDGAHRRMIMLRKKKRDVMIPQLPSSLFGRDIDSDADGFEDIGAPATARRRPVSVLCYAQPRTGQDERDRSRDVDRADRIATRPAHVDDVEFMQNRQTAFPHRARGSDDF